MICFDKRVDILKFEDKAIYEMEQEAKEQERVRIEEEMQEESERRKKLFKYRLRR